MSLKARLEAELAATGPISVAEYMLRCLFDPKDGYYSTRPRLGAEGDFVTAPLVSQMFGEMLGLWSLAVWEQLGAPSRFRWVEVGPGDGTLMADMLRATRHRPDFVTAIEVVLVEPSRPLRAVQEQRLSDTDVPCSWIPDLAGLDEDLPVILIANEVLDCLPARQFLRQGESWFERRVGLDETGTLAFGLVPAPEGFEPPCDAKDGQIVEVSLAQQAFGAAIGHLLSACTGAALLIDYGRDRPGPGDTLQALRHHQKLGPLDAPGESDLTVWADFPAVVSGAMMAGADCAGIREQGAFLLGLGIGERTAHLRAANPDRADTLARQLARLTAPDQMGELFKVTALFSPKSMIIPGF